MGFRRRGIEQGLSSENVNLIEQELIQGVGPGQAGAPGLGTEVDRDLQEELALQAAKGDIPLEKRRARNIRNEFAAPTLEQERGARAEFREQIGTDILAAQESFQEAQQELGVGGPEAQAQAQRQLQRGIRIGGQVIAQKEFDENVQTQERVINDLVQTSGFKDQQTANIFADQLRTRINKARQDLLQRSLEFQKELRKQKLDAQKKAAIFKNIGAIAGAVGGALVAGPAGAAVGSQLGGQVGGAAGSI